MGSAANGHSFEDEKVDKFLMFLFFLVFTLLGYSLTRLLRL
jgi:hypothetical protein